jgi:hypothetical protein
MKSTRSYFVGISSSADGSKLRTDTFNNISYIVVPIVSAVGDQVWWPINSPTPVLILSSVLATHAATRNFRPVVMGHPKISGDYVSANSPQILQDYSFGFMFNSVFDDGRIKVEAWLDPLRAKAVGAAAENVIARLQAGENVEVSEGNAILAISEDGIFNGKKYGARWISAVSDHLAMLDVGEIGACDNKMGCGRLDVSATKFQDRTIIELISTNASKIVAKSESKFDNIGAFTMKDNIFARMLAKIRASMSNNSLRWNLFQAVSELEPGVQYVDDEDVETKTVRYVVMICYGYSWEDSSEREYHTYQRTFTVDADNNVTVNNDRVELVFDETKAWIVKPTTANDVADVMTPETAMEPMAASTATATIEPKTAKSCKCHDEDKNKGENTMTPAQKNLATQLITSAAAPFEESDRGVLEAMSEEKLKTLAAKFEENKSATETAPIASTATPAPAVASAPAIDPNSVTITREEYASIRAAADAHAAQVAARKTYLVASLKVAQTGLLETDLNEMTVATLEKLAVSFKIDFPTTADYSLRGVPESRTSTTVSTRKLPDTWGLENKTN